jgi:Ca2+-transporting ATPase
MLATNSMEIWVMLLAPFFFPEFGLPLLPIQILWINLVTDGPPAIALAMEPPEPDVMTRPPRPPSESLFARGVGFHILWVGLFITGLALLAVWIGHEGHWNTMIFLVVTFAQMAHVLVIRSEVETVWKRGIRSNPWLIGAILLTVGLTLLVVYVPVFQPIFKTQALELDELALCFGLSLLVIVAVEIEKAIWRRKARAA